MLPSPAPSFENPAGLNGLIGASLAFEFRLGAEVMMVMFISVCYCLSGKLCLDPSACVVLGRPDSIWAPLLGQG